MRGFIFLLRNLKKAANNFIMQGEEKPVCLWLTPEEADEILSRCLQSEENDTPAFRSALLQLAKAAFGSPVEPSHQNAA